MVRDAGSEPTTWTSSLPPEFCLVVGVVRLYVWYHAQSDVRTCNLLVARLRMLVPEPSLGKWGQRETWQPRPTLLFIIHIHAIIYYISAIEL